MDYNIEKIVKNRDNLPHSLDRNGLEDVLTTTNTDAEASVIE